MTVNGETEVLGIIGNPIKHTMSPAIHNFLSAELGINEIYVPFEVKGDPIGAVKGAFELGIRGMNVTVPYKSAVIPALSDIDEMAARIGAVNTLVRTENGFKGYNTDITGLERELDNEGISLEGRDAVIIGAGGAARAVAFLCVSRKCSSVSILNRTLLKADRIAEDIRDYADDIGEDVSVRTAGIADTALLDGDRYIVFQCTKLGLNADDEAAIKDRSFYEKTETGIDLIYTEGTAFQKYVEETGGRAYTGLGMLVNQGVAAYELWNDMIVPKELTDRIYEEL